MTPERPTFYPQKRVRDASTARFDPLQIVVIKKYRQPGKSSRPKIVAMILLGIGFPQKF